MIPRPWPQPAAANRGRGAPGRRLPALAGLVLLSLTTAAPAALRVGPAPGVLWAEDFVELERSNSLSEYGWLPTGTPELLPTADGMALRARGPASRAALSRLVPYDLETAETRGSFPYLVLDLAGAEASMLAGVGLRGEVRRPGRPLIEQADQPGLYLFDLRRHFPELDGHRGLFPLTLLLGGASLELPGPATTVRSLRCLAEPPVGVDLSLGAAEARLRDGERLTITVRLAEPAEAVRVDTWRAGPPLTPLLFNGAPAVDLFPADDSGLLWSWTLTVGAGTTSLSAPGAELLLRVVPAGQAPFATTAWFELALGQGAPVRPAVAPARPPLVPRLDGRLDDEAWRVAPAHELRQPDPAALPAAWRVIAGDDGLYVGLIARSDDADDRFQVTLSPADQPTDWRRFEVRPGGTMTAERWRAGARVDGWETEWRAASTVLEEGWSAELLLPWAALELGEGAAAGWGLQVTRQAAGATVAWAPGEGPVPGALAGLPDLAAYRLAAGEPRFATRLTPQGVELELRVTVTNQTGRPLPVTARAGVFLADGRVTTADELLRLPPDEPRELCFALPLPVAGSYRVAWQVTTAAPPDLRLAGRRQVEAVLRPLAARWLPDPAELVAEVTPAAWLPAGSRIVAELRRGEQLLAAQSAPIATEPLMLRFARPANPAECRLVVTARRGEEKLGEVELAVAGGEGG